jgi:hypothetical protein
VSLPWHLGRLGSISNLPDSCVGVQVPINFEVLKNLIYFPAVDVFVENY